MVLYDSMKRSIKPILLVALIGLLLFFFFRSLDFSQVGAHITGTKIRWLWTMFLFMPLQYYFRSLRWRLLLGKEKVSLGDVFSSTSLGFAFNYLLPGRIGEWLRAYLLGRKGGLSTSYTFATVVLERLLDLGATVFLAGLFFPFRKSLMGSFSSEPTVLTLISKGSLLAFLFLLSIAIFLFFLYRGGERSLALWTRWVHRFCPARWAKPLAETGERFLQGVISFFGNPHKGAILFHSLMVWIFIAASYWVGLWDFALTMKPFAIIPYVVALLAGSSIPTPGMVGGFEALSQLALTGLYGMEANKAAAATILFHFSLIFATFLTALPFFFREGGGLFRLALRRGEERP